jgi:hypothetical protein
MYVWEGPPSKRGQNTLGNVPSNNTKHVFKESNHTLKSENRGSKEVHKLKYELIKSKSQNSFSFSSV